MKGKTGKGAQAEEVWKNRREFGFREDILGGIITNGNLMVTLSKTDSATIFECNILGKRRRN